MAEVTMNFNGIDLADYIDINDVRRDIGNESTSDLLPLSELGVESLPSKIGPKYIEVDFSIWTKDRNLLKHTLAGIFHTTSCCKLVFSDEEDKYYLAKKIGKISMKEMKGYRSSGTITFLVPDGVAHSVEEKTFSGTTKTTVQNNGNIRTYPIIKVTTSAESGWIGIANPTGTFELGKRAEVDMNYKELQVPLIRSSSEISSKQTSTPTGDLAGGTLVTSSDGKITLGTKGGWGDGKKWAGGYNVATFAGAGTGEAVFYSNFKLVAETGKLTQTGLLKVIFMDSSNRIVAMYEIHKGSTVKNEATFRMYYGGNSLRLHKEFKFAPSNKANENFLRSSTHGTVDFEKYGGRLRFFYFGQYYHITVPELAEIPITKVGIFIGQYGTRDLVTDHYFTHLGVKSFYCVRKNLDVQNGVDNLFQPGDIVEIDMGAAEVAINGIPRNDLVVTGSDYLFIPPGPSEIVTQYSSWTRVNDGLIGMILGNQPNIEVTFREEWL